MDPQHILDILFGLLGALGLFLMKNIHSDLKELEKRHDDIPNVYARRDDVKDLNDRIFAQLDRIELKLDRKQDKIG